MTAPAPDCYVGRMPCGCLVAWVSDLTEDRAKVVADWIRSGYTVERANTDSIRSQLGPCKHRRREEAQGRLL